MKYSIENYKEVVKQYLSEWSRSIAYLSGAIATRFGKGCIIWDSEEDGDKRSGVFCAKDKLCNYFSSDRAVGLEKMIEEANHDVEVVVVLLFKNKAMGLRLWKYEGQQEGEVVPPIVI